MKKSSIILLSALALIVLKPEILTGTLRLLRPIFIGAGIAFVMNRPIFRIETTLGGLFKNAGQKLISGVSAAIGYILLLCLLAGVFVVIIPELSASVTELAGNFDTYYSNLQSYYAVLESKDSFGIMKVLSDFAGSLVQSVPALIEKTYDKTAVIFSWLLDGVIGFVISIYILIGKRDIKKGVSAVVRAFAGKEKFERVSKYYRLVFRSFSRFVSGQTTEAFILGSLCFIGMKIFRFEYAPLISVIIGVTALIPVVGAIVGALPSAFLLFLNNPMSAVWFLLFLIILQQLENHLIYPRVVGKSLGLPPLLVIIAIVLGAGLGGAVGIITAVPVMAVFYAVAAEYTNNQSGVNLAESNVD